MKKTFLIPGLIAGLFTTNGYAVQNTSQNNDNGIYVSGCPSTCRVVIDGTAPTSGGNIAILYHCETEAGELCEPTTKVNNKVNYNVLQKKQNKVSSRSAEIPKMVKKIVYEQIVKEDEE
ncbi:MAG: hypothetical protein ACLRFP_05220 [Alphaproteobacteria bacterium]